MKMTMVMVTVHEGCCDVFMVTVPETGDDGGRGGHGCEHAMFRVEILMYNVSLTHSRLYVYR